MCNDTLTKSLEVPWCYNYGYKSVCVPISIRWDVGGKAMRKISVSPVNFAITSYLL
jgi:hypothetical protein